MTQGAPVQTVGNDNLVRLTVDVNQVVGLLRVMPKVGYFWLRNFFGAALGQHRKHWLGIKGTKFGRGRTGIRVGAVNDKKATGGPLSIAYRVRPEAPRAESAADGIAKLNSLEAEVFTGSTALQVHQFGEDVRSKRFMAIAVKTRPTTPARWQAKYPNKQLVFRPSQKDANTALLYELTRLRGRGRPRKDGKGNTVREQLRMRFLLTKFVDMKPTLKLFEAWEQLAGKRDQQWAATASRIAADVATADARDR
jgi:hypothetical protein